MYVQQKIEFSYGNQHKEAISSLGVALTRLVLKNFSDCLLQCLAAVFGSKLFVAKGSQSSGGELLRLSSVFDMKGYKYLRVTPELKNEHCCFFHFLLGKKRNLSKGYSLEVD